MRRRLPQPRHARIFPRRIRVEALGDGVANEGGAFFPKQFDQPLLFGHERVDFGGFPVEEGGDGDLFGEGWNRK